MDIIVQVKNCIKAAIYQVKANISVYSRHSGIDFIRKRKLTLPVLIRFWLCLESNSLGKSLLTFFDKGNPPTEPAVVQQQRKLLPAGKVCPEPTCLACQKDGIHPTGGLRQTVNV